jgi:hypothetical protein
MTFMSAVSLLLIRARVTRLGVFVLFGQLSILRYIFKKWWTSQNLWATFSHRESYELIFRIFFGFILCEFFINSSGHPEEGWCDLCKNETRIVKLVFSRWRHFRVHANKADWVRIGDQCYDFRKKNWDEKIGENIGDIDTYILQPIMQKKLSSHFLQFFSEKMIKIAWSIQTWTNLA